MKSLHGFSPVFILFSKYYSCPTLLKLVVLYPRVQVDHLSIFIVHRQTFSWYDIPREVHSIILPFTFYITLCLILRVPSPRRDHSWLYSLTLSRVRICHGVRQANLHTLDEALVISIDKYFFGRDINVLPEPGHLWGAWMPVCVRQVGRASFVS